MPLTPPYSLLTRTAKGSQLTIEEMDGNLLWLSTTMSGSINSITGSLGISGSNIEIVTSLFNLFSETLITGSVTINPNSIPNPISGSYTLGGSVTFNGDLTITSGSELIIPTGVAFTLNGALINNGDLVNSGSYINLAPTSPYMTLSVLGNVSASAYYGDGSNLTGIATSSYSFFAVSASYAVSASHEIIKEVSSSYADVAGGLTGQPSIYVTNITASGNISASGDITANSFTGSFSGSYIGDGSGLTGVIATINTSSFATTGSNIFNGSQNIIGSLTISGSEQCSLHVFSNTAGSGVSLKDNTTTDDDQVGIGALGNHLCFRAGGAPAGNMRLLNTGNLGVGNLNPPEKLTVEGNISSSGYISASSFYGDGSGLFNLPESNDLKVYLNFESATSYAYITPYNLQFDSYYTSSTMTLQFSSSGAEYIFGTPLNQYDILSITSSAVGLVTLSGSKL